VEKLAEKLRAEGLDPWMDRAEFLPGQDWQNEIETALDEASVFLFVLSDKSLKSPWQQVELGMALRSAVGKSRMKVILVLLSGTDRAALPTFLRSHATVDFDPGDEDRAVESIAQAAETSDA
jgi:hypothetical protein